MSEIEKTVLVFVLRGNKLLLAERKNTWFENNLYLTPGGLVDEGESVATAAARELKEETGIYVEPSELVPIKQADITTTRGRTFENHYLLAKKLYW